MEAIHLLKPRADGLVERSEEVGSSLTGNRHELNFFRVEPNFLKEGN